MQKISYFFIALFLTSAALAKNPDIDLFPQAPWITGPLISPSSHVTPPGVVNIEPYYYCTFLNGKYNSDWKKKSAKRFWINEFQLYTNIGLTNWMDLYFNPGLVCNRCQGRKSCQINDPETGFDFQLLMDQTGKWWPAIKFSIREIFPAGRYDHLDPNKFGTDVGGFGSYQSYFVLCAGWLVHLWERHWLNLLISSRYTVPSRVHVRGVNAFGGAKNTNAYVYPGQSFDFDFAFEFTLNQHWVFACDNAFTYLAPTKSKGYPGRLDTGQLADLSQSCSAYFSLAPAIEYNWSDYVGIITGAWFTIAGRNALTFISSVTALNVVF
jgi:hypothetical protein